MQVNISCDLCKYYTIELDVEETKYVQAKPRTYCTTYEWTGLAISQAVKGMVSENPDLIRAMKRGAAEIVGTRVYLRDAMWFTDSLFLAPKELAGVDLPIEMATTLLIGKVKGNRWSRDNRVPSTGDVSTVASACARLTARHNVHPTGTSMLDEAACEACEACEAYEAYESYAEDIGDR